MREELGPCRVKKVIFIQDRTYSVLPWTDRDRADRESFRRKAGMLNRLSDAADEEMTSFQEGDFRSKDKDSRRHSSRYTIMLGKLALIASSLLLSSAVNSDAFQQRSNPYISAPRSLATATSLSMNGGSQAPAMPSAVLDLKVRTLHNLESVTDFHHHRFTFLHFLFAFYFVSQVTCRYLLRSGQCGGGQSFCNMGQNF